MHPFDNALRFEFESAEHLRGRTQPEWANLVGPFGGISAAALLRAIEQHPDCCGDPRALTVNYLCPLVDGTFDILVRLARVNRTNQHWTAELRQLGDARVNATEIFGHFRETWSDTELQPPPAPAPEQTAVSDLSDIVAFAGNYDMRFVEGAVPDGRSAHPMSTTTLWVRDSRSRRIDPAALAALCDVFYPRVYLRRGALMPASTVTLTTYFHGGREQLDAHGNDFVLGTAHANCFANGYFDQTAQLWSRISGLLATSHQLVYFKDP